MARGDDLDEVDARDARHERAAQFVEPVGGGREVRLFPGLKPEGVPERLAAHSALRGTRGKEEKDRQERDQDGETAADRLRAQVPRQPP
ncbi:hypothetical protein Pph01_74320 [Planotetraspora phitsanulokensis]|uniref:Uncharacterized protein n=1 Tax=Planotetraspora phitsanulokensis TaxID=575192 RepID=A0A8J3UBK9_9ACTN|nr:hypothetical protein Pph01_74320 [Planotetraspora phitsanulokensis]